MFSIINALLGATLFLALCTYLFTIKLKKDISNMFKTFTLQYLELEESKLKKHTMYYGNGALQLIGSPSCS